MLTKISIDTKMGSISGGATNEFVYKALMAAGRVVSSFEGVSSSKHLKFIEEVRISFQCPIDSVFDGPPITEFEFIISAGWFETGEIKLKVSLRHHQDRWFMHVFMKEGGRPITTVYMQGEDVDAYVVALRDAIKKALIYKARSCYQEARLIEQFVKSLI